MTFFGPRGRDWYELMTGEISHTRTHVSGAPVWVRGRYLIKELLRMCTRRSKDENGFLSLFVSLFFTRSAYFFGNLGLGLEWILQTWLMFRALLIWVDFGTGLLFGICGGFQVPTVWFYNDIMGGFFLLPSEETVQSKINWASIRHPEVRMLEAFPDFCIHWLNVLAIIQCRWMMRYDGHKSYQFWRICFQCTNLAQKD